MFVDESSHALVGQESIAKTTREPAARLKRPPAAQKVGCALEDLINRAHVCVKHFEST